MAASMLRTKSFVVMRERDGGGGRLGLSNWWNEIENSEQWQQGIFYTLCASYALVSLIALVQFVRIQLRVPEYGWTTQKVFHLMNFVVNGCRVLLPKSSNVICFCTALGFLTYGGRLFFMLRRFPIESTGRRKKLHEVGFVTGICCTCFLIRCFVVALSAFDEDADVDVLNHPILNFVYYMTVEIFPSALVLFILRKLPPRRISDQYHPIQ
ncbi:hypothetical protein TEA_020885 [Camellia sinensis var. sinensis]|uniref:THH1/TOM1/TOM3 domain-containing protein n=1 Tax=Camellia sinensis var. sinensis TaxID=542762 RepID=A0A4S4DI65_CAMSN|nr:hypothetical protein TEA_020885 [Camellia sinensis var. sinensis]